MINKYGSLLFTTSNGTEYYSADSNGIANIKFKAGHHVKIDSDVMDSLIYNNYLVSVTSPRLHKYESRYRNGYASVKTCDTSISISTLHAYVTDIPPEKQSLFIFHFIDNDSLNFTRSNIVVYKRVTKIDEKDNISTFRFNKVILETQKLETHFIQINSEYEHVLFNDDIKDYVNLSVVENDQGDRYVRFSKNAGPISTYSLPLTIVNQSTKICEKLNDLGIKLKIISKINRYSLDYTLSNLSLMQRHVPELRENTHDLFHLENVIYNAGSNEYRCCPGSIFGKVVKKLILSISAYNFNDIKQLMTDFNSDIERIRGYSVQDLLDDDTKFNELIELYNGKIVERYRIKANKVKFSRSRILEKARQKVK